MPSVVQGFVLLPWLLRDVHSDQRSRCPGWHVAAIVAPAVAHTQFTSMNRCAEALQSNTSKAIAGILLKINETNPPILAYKLLERW